jgi:hypothetical protein
MPNEEKIIDADYIELGEAYIDPTTGCLIDERGEYWYTIKQIADDNNISVQGIYDKLRSNEKVQAMVKGHYTIRNNVKYLDKVGREAVLPKAKKSELSIQEMYRYQIETNLNLSQELLSSKNEVIKLQNEIQKLQNDKHELEKIEFAYNQLLENVSNRLDSPNNNNESSDQSQDPEELAKNIVKEMSFLDLIKMKFGKK